MSDARENQPDDDSVIIMNGRATLGFIQPGEREFEVYAAAGEGFVLVGKVRTQAEAKRLLNDAASKEEARR